MGQRRQGSGCPPIGVGDFGLSERKRYRSAKMFKYIYEDMISVLEHLPYGLALGIPIALLLLCFMTHGGAQKKRASSVIPVAVYALYLGILLVITFFSRESGSTAGTADLKLFSTWGINTRNNAYVVENILLFIPYGFLLSWVFEWARGFWKSMWFGAVTSVAVECLQLVTGRGFFQIDDILTNILGSMIGYLIFRICMVFKLCMSRRMRAGQDT